MSTNNLQDAHVQLFNDFIAEAYGCAAEVHASFQAGEFLGEEDQYDQIMSSYHPALFN